MNTAAHRVSSRNPPNPTYAELQVENRRLRGSITAAADTMEAEGTNRIRVALSPGARHAGQALVAYAKNKLRPLETL